MYLLDPETANQAGFTLGSTNVFTTSYLDKTPVITQGTCATNVGTVNSSQVNGD